MSFTPEFFDKIDRNKSLLVLGSNPHGQMFTTLAAARRPDIKILGIIDIDEITHCAGDVRPVLRHALKDYSHDTQVILCSDMWERHIGPIYCSEFENILVFSDFLSGNSGDPIKDSEHLQQYLLRTRKLPDLIPGKYADNVCFLYNKFFVETDEINNHPETVDHVEYALAAQWLREMAPSSLLSVASCRMFSASLLALCPVTHATGLPCIPGSNQERLLQCDITSLPIKDQSQEAVISLHGFSQAGLSRLWNEPFDLEADEKVAREIIRVLAPGGNAVISCCINIEPQLKFNAQRIYDYESILGLFAGLEVVMEKVIVAYLHADDHQAGRNKSDSVQQICSVEKMQNLGQGSYSYLAWLRKPL